MAKSRRRGFKSWFVEPYKQVRLGLMFLLVNFAFAALFIGVFGYIVYDMYAAVMTYFKLSGSEGAVTSQKFIFPMLIGVALMFLFIVTTILVSVRYTHEIYGPLVSIHRYLDDILAGRSPQVINLRESDQLQDLAKKLNSVAERLVSDQRAGPLINVHRFLDDINDGKRPDPIKLRDNDHFGELAAKLNKILDRLPKT
jgi:nitrogen fixation/metabolism regulation signal transduction histidine kinase